MAIGDKPNQNLFGTDYNAEDEEEKKARLAAQGAMMGAGNIPALDSNIVAQVPGIQNIRNPGAFDPANMEPARPIMSAGTVERVTPNSLAVNKISDVVQGLRDAVGTESVSMDEYRAAQAAQAASNLEATPSVTPPAERPMAGAQEQPGAVVSPFLQSPDTPSGLGGPLLRGFEMVNDAAQGPNAPMGQEATRAALGGMTLNEYLNAPAGTEGVSGLQTDPQGRMIPAGFETRAEAFPSYEANAAQREAGLAARPDFNEAVSDRDRRAARGDDISMADQTDMAKANDRNASPTEVARGNQVANALGVDLETGQPLQATGGLTFDQVMKMEDFNFKQGQETYKREQDALVAQGKATEAFEQDSSLLRQVSGDAGRIGRLTNEAIGLATEPGTTALSGSLLKHVAGSDANQLKSILAVISSKVALDRLMEVKKTGATLGQVSEKELAMLQNSFDALDQSLPPERLREALTNYANQLKKVEDQTQRAFIDKHGQDKFNKIMGGGSMGQGEPKYANDQNVGDSADTYYNPSK